ncbi:von Willebrand factor A domain-containing protein 5A [Perca flavescens]|uniref:von Willebrand factor A domain-containing protein 5A n=1 Tax=Perca flavescens TaxID=8167 RepID=UPI00106E7321|nr:von Willebrand factor A domain-containing protein 5A-like [Perca flavescens]
MVNCWGLLTSQKEPVPLKSVEVELEVRDHVATVVSTLNYENKEDKPLEAVFVVPLPGTKETDKNGHIWVKCNDSSKNRPKLCFIVFPSVSWSVPLKSVEVELEVRDHVATVVSTLNYENKEDKPLEAVFVFPLPGDAAVCHFSAKIGQTEIVAEVKEKQKAREEYDDALSSGREVFLLEESDQSPDIFSLSVGSLHPGESASIRLEYVTELAVQADEGLRFSLPAVLNPRYQPRGSEDVCIQVTSVPASLVPYSLSFSARVSSPRPVSKVESNCPLDALQYLNTEQTQATAL